MTLAIKSPEDPQLDGGIERRTLFELPHQHATRAKLLIKRSLKVTDDVAAVGSRLEFHECLAVKRRATATICGRFRAFPSKITWRVRRYSSTQARTKSQ